MAVLVRVALMIEDGCAVECLKRQLWLPVSTMWQ